MYQECYEKQAFYESIVFQSCQHLIAHRMLQRHGHVAYEETLQQREEP